MPILRADAKELAGNRHADIQQLMHLMPGALSSARAASTMKRYCPSWGYFKEWCADYDLSFLPAAPLTVALYLLMLTQKANSFSIIKMASAAIAAFHSFASQPEVTTAPIVNAIREHAKRKLPDGVNKKEPLPWEKVEEVCKLLAERPASSGRLRNLSLAAAISLGFCGFLRYDDLSRLTVEQITVSPDLESLEIRLGTRKNSPYRSGGDITVTAVNGFADPVQLVAILIRHAGLVDGSRPLFSAVTRCQGREVYGSTPISYGCLRVAMLEVFLEVGLPKEKFGTHSMRSGGATLAANSGVPDRLWMEHGGWKSFRSAVGYVKTSKKGKGQYHQGHVSRHLIFVALCAAPIPMLTECSLVLVA
ncbi:g7457 [Coccomyxa viridis]|uniref:G7457 protein n=1 Tax=Coccomyxa viridis TaxID=1274662 RepID=A0ABP1FXW4_9CHLO